MRKGGITFNLLVGNLEGKEWCNLQGSAEVSQPFIKGHYWRNWLVFGCNCYELVSVFFYSCLGPAVVPAPWLSLGLFVSCCCLILEGSLRGCCLCSLLWSPLCGLQFQLACLLVVGLFLLFFRFVARGRSFLGGGGYGEIIMISSHLKPCATPSVCGVLCACVSFRPGLSEVSTL
jgi:hypothetical protein